MSALERNEYLKRFARAEALLTERGYKVVNPSKFLFCRWPWLYRLIGYNAALCYDLWRLSRCDSIYLLPGWRESRGASVESFFAWKVGVYRLAKEESREIDLKLAKWIDRRQQTV